MRLLTKKPIASLAGAGLRTFFRIAEKWSLSNAQQMTLLGLGAPSTFFKWRKEQPDAVPRDTLERVSYILGIYQALHILLPDDAAADSWVHRPNTAPMFAGKPHVFEAISVHRDDVDQLPAGTQVLAGNEMGVQAVELRLGPGTIWAVQYHPEYSYAEIAATTLRYADALLGEALFEDRTELEQFVAELRQLMHDPHNRRLAWKHGLGPAMQHERLKLAELRNWLELQVMPHYRRRH